MTVTDALRQAAASGVDRLDAQLLLLHVLGRPHDRAWLLAHDADALPPSQEHAFAALCRRRAAGEPVAYLTGTREFFGLTLQVDTRVLVPRPETELLVEWALEILRPLRSPRVLDLGTGSGAIALAIKHGRPDVRMDAVDASADALEVAAANAAALGLAIGFRHGRWLDGIADCYDLIVSNPPYVRQADPHLAALRHEPLAALVAGADGLDDIRCLAATAPGHLQPGGWLLLEHGWDQSAAAQALLAQAGLTDVQGRTDLAGIERCAGGRRSELG